MATSINGSARKSRVMTISMPEEMASKVERLAGKENRTVSELMREAFRCYLSQRFDRAMEAIGKYGETDNTQGYTDEDIVRMVKDVRAERRAEREAAELTASKR